MLKRPKRLALLSIGFLLTGCATNISETNIADTSCKSFRPISASSKDTEPTKRQVVAHNKVYDALCPSKG